MKRFDENIIALIDMLEYDMWIVTQDSHIDCPCKNFDTKQGKRHCPYCFGTGHKVKIKKIKGVRQPLTDSVRDVRVDYEHGVFFLKNIYDLKEKDFIVWHDEIEEVTFVERHCSDAQKPVYYRIETTKKKSDTEFFLKNFCRLIGKQYQRRM